MSGKTIKTKEYSFGSCVECYKHLYTKVYRKIDPEFEKPENAIANKKCFGYTPKVLTDLNETELALISKCRVDRHLINLTGGSHKCIVGWHTLYYNDSQKTAKVMSYYRKALRRKYPIAVTDNDDAYENPIHVVLTGPFTVHQKNLALKKLKCESVRC